MDPSTLGNVASNVAQNIPFTGAGTAAANTVNQFTATAAAQVGQALQVAASMYNSSFN
jgi:hypothetical protein